MRIVSVATEVLALAPRMFPSHIWAMHAAPQMAEVASLVGDPARANILCALLDGRALTAGELAFVAGVSPQTTSGHLAKLHDARLIDLCKQGRHRYYRLAGHEVAAALEALGPISPALPVRSLRQSREAVSLAVARTCYDHLAGRAGVELLDALVRHGLLTREKSKSLSRTGSGDAITATRFEATGAGARTFASFGINVTEIRRSRRNFAGECFDWTERRGHLNGALAAAVTTRLFELGWIERGPRRRSVRITAAGAEGLAFTFGLDLAQEGPAFG